MFHNGFFSPRYHGALGQKRADYYKKELSVDDTNAKLKVLYALFTNHDGSTLRDEVLRSLNQVNVGIFVKQLDGLIGGNKSEIEGINRAANAAC